jgi:hypothetical protein
MFRELHDYLISHVRYLCAQETIMRMYKFGTTNCVNQVIDYMNENNYILLDKAGNLDTDVADEAIIFGLEEWFYMDYIHYPEPDAEDYCNGNKFYHEGLMNHMPEIEYFASKVKIVTIHKIIIPLFPLT